jgi:hypothetical protein
MKALGLLLLLLAAIAVFSSGVAFAADSAVSKAVGDASSASPSATGTDWNTSDLGDLTADQRYRWLQEQHRQTQLMILVGAMTIALVIVLFFLRAHGRHTSDTLVNGAGLVLVIFGTLYVSECAITSEQLTAPMGILGAIAGYIFGSIRRPPPTTSPSPPVDAETPPPG